MLSLAELTRSFRHQGGDDYQLLVGFEYEVFLFDRATAQPLAYEGPRGLRRALTRAAELGAGEVLNADVPNAARLASGAQISLEPGGQFEFSSAPVASFAACIEQLDQFLMLLGCLRDELDLLVFCGGATPVHTIDEIGLVIPKRRYQMMDAYFPRVGGSGRRMMRQTASVQVTFDYQNEALGTELLRAACYVAPLAAALFANAPYLDGRRTQYRSVRVPIWDDTDPARCGLIPGFCSAEFSFEDYVRHVVKAPMFFVDNGGEMLEARGLTFEQFNRDGFGGRQATLDDFVLHNSTIFTDARLKHTVEVRSLDAQKPSLVPSALALLCGLLLCSGARKRTLALLGSLSEQQFADLPLELAEQGLSAAMLCGRPASELMLELIDYARQGLINCFEDGGWAGRFLEPLAALTRAGQTPADVVIATCGDDPHRWLTEPVDLTPIGQRQELVKLAARR